MILPSPSNTVTANQLLFRDVNAKTLLFSPEGFDILEDLHNATRDDLRWIETPKFDDLMSRKTVDVFPFEHTFEQVRNKKFLGLHTSGTTGHPKYGSMFARMFKEITPGLYCILLVLMLTSMIIVGLFSGPMPPFPSSHLN